MREGGDRVEFGVVSLTGTATQELSRRCYVSIGVLSSDETLKVASGSAKVYLGDPAENTCLPRGGCDDKVTVMTNFQCDHLVVHLKERGILGGSTVLGSAIFPRQYFSKYTAESETSEKSFLLKMLKGDDCIVTASIRLQIRVPGGFPHSALTKSYRVKGVKMSEKRLVVTVVNATVRSAAPLSTVFGNIANQQKSTGPSLSVSMTVPTHDMKLKTAVAKPGNAADFGESFTLSRELERCQFLAFKLKDSSKWGQQKTVGGVSIPIRFFLAQSIGHMMEETFDVCDEGGKCTGRLKLRLKIAGGDEASPVAEASEPAPTDAFVDDLMRDLVIE